MTERIGDIKTIKCVTVGDVAVGKTCMLMSYIEGEFPKHYVPTVFDNCNKTCVNDGRTVLLSCYDTAGQEHYDNRRCPNPDITLVCFDTTSEESLKSVRNRWVPEVTTYYPTQEFILVGTKIDKRQDIKVQGNKKSTQYQKVTRTKAVTEGDGKKAAVELKAATYIECSAKSREGLNHVFDEAIRIVLRKDNNGRNVYLKQDSSLKCRTKKCVLV